MLAGSWVSLRCARYLVRDDRVYPFAMAVVVGGLVGARVAHVADNWPLYSSRPQDIVAFWNGGIGTMGAPIGSAIAGLPARPAPRLPLRVLFAGSVIRV